MNRKQELGDESGPFKSSRTKLTQTQELGDEIGYFAMINLGNILCN
jgi:hypothetical protein